MKFFHTTVSVGLLMYVGAKADFGIYRIEHTINDCSVESHCKMQTLPAGFVPWDPDAKVPKTCKDKDLNWAGGAEPDSTNMDGGDMFWPNGFGGQKPVTCHASADPPSCEWGGNHYSCIKNTGRPDFGLCTPHENEGYFFGLMFTCKVPLTPNASF